MKSEVQVVGNVVFPDFTGERVYMRKFNKSSGLPSDLKRWQNTVDAMLDGVDANGDIFIMIDQGFVRCGSSHRRAGVHIDGYWHEEIKAHRGSGGHRGVSCYTGSGGGGGGSHYGGKTGWEEVDFSISEDLILASNISACRAFVGEYDGKILHGGDASLIDVSRMEQVIMKPNVAYRGNVSMLHESLPVVQDCYRTLVRLNVKAA